MHKNTIINQHLLNMRVQKRAGTPLPQSHSLANILPWQGWKLKISFDLLNKLAPGRLWLAVGLHHHHYAAVSAFCVNRFTKINIFRKRSFKTHNFLSLTNFISSLTILSIQIISSAQDIRYWTEEFDIRTDSKETLSIKSARSLNQTAK